MDEKELIQRCRQQDRQAQQELYARTSDRIYGLLLRMTRNQDDAFDLTQETYLRVFRSIHQFEGTASITTWIYRVAVNEAQQFLRRKKRHERALSEQEQAVASETTDEHQLERLDLEDALAKLPEAERTLILLRYFEGLSYGEMAEVLEKPSGTIASGLNRAREMLRQYLAPKHEETA